MSKSLFIILLLSIYTVYGQKNKELWLGSSSFLGSNYPLSIELDENNATITSYGKEKDTFIKYEAKVQYSGSKLTLTGSKLIEKQGSSGCIATITLEQNSSGKIQLLEGKWRPNRTKGGCLIGMSGKVNLVKSSTSNSTPLKETNDSLTKEVIDGLKERNYHALVITNNVYEDNTIQSLSEPINDGRRLIDVLKTEYHFDSEHIIELNNATRSQTLESLEKLAQTLGERDNLLIFYGGHGVWDEKIKQGYWLPVDGFNSSKSNWISNTTIRDYLKAIPTRHTLLIVDACFSGGLLKSRGNGKSMLNLYNLPSRKAITSGTLTSVPDKSVFIDYLLKKLKENTHNLLSAGELFYSLKIAVIQNSPYNQIPQYGPIHQCGDEGGEFIFLKD